MKPPIGANTSPKPVKMSGKTHAALSPSMRLVAGSLGKYVTGTGCRSTKRSHSSELTCASRFTTVPFGALKR